MSFKARVRKRDSVAGSLNIVVKTDRGKLIRNVCGKRQRTKIQSAFSCCYVFFAFNAAHLCLIRFKTDLVLFAMTLTERNA